VRYLNGQAAPDALVLIDGLLLETSTDKDGKYTLKGVPSGIQTVVALKRGFKPARKMNLEIHRGNRVQNLDFVLEKDPSFVPDAIKFDQVTPPPDSILPPNQDVEIKGVIRYRLRNERSARVVLSFQDDKNNPLLPDQPRFDIKQGSSYFPFRRTVHTPARFGNAEFYVFAVLLPVNRSQVDATDTLTYQVRTFKDDVRFTAVAISSDEGRADQARFSASLDFVLDTVQIGTVRLRLLGDSGPNDFDERLFEDTATVNREPARSGNLNFSGAFTIPSRCKRLKLRADLIPAGGAEAKLIKWSRAYPVPESPKEE
jgi:hypothetical protein